MSQSLGEIKAQISNSDENAEPAPVRKVAARGKFNTMLMSLAGRVIPSDGREAELELVATLESEGITDAVARGYGVTGVTSVFSLANSLLEEPISAAAGSADTVSQPKPRTQSTERLLPSILRSILVLGMMGIMLIGVQWYEAAMHVIGVPDQATLMGMFAGMVIASGMMQATGWRVSVALSQGTPGVVRPVMRLGMICGMSIALVVSVVLVAIGIWQQLPFAGLIGLGTSCIGLTLLLLLSGGLVLLNRTPFVGAALGLAGGVAWLAHFLNLTPASGFATVALGYATAIILLATMLIMAIRRLARGGRTTQRLPPLGQLMYNATPYLFYGTLTVLYVFVGQISGWIGRLPDGWSRSEAIGALNIAHLLGLTTIVLSQGVAEYGLRIFWHVVREAQADTKLFDYEALKTLVGGFLRRHLQIVMLSQIAISIVFAALALWAWQVFRLGPVLGPLEPTMLVSSLIGYSLLLWGLFGCSFSVTVAHPWLAVQALFIATLIELVCGLTLGVFFSFEASLVGTIGGGVALVLIGRRTLAHLLDRVDYLLYQAF